MYVSAIENRMNELRKHENNEQVMEILERNITAAGHGGILQDREISEREIIIVI